MVCWIRIDWLSEQCSIQYAKLRVTECVIDANLTYLYLGLAAERETTFIRDKTTHVSQPRDTDGTYV